MRDSESCTPPLSSGLKLLALLNQLAVEPHSVSVAALSRVLGRPRSEVHKQLVTLVSAGWMDQQRDGTYALTLRAAQLGQRALEHSGMSERLEEYLDKLAHKVGEASSIAVLDGTRARIVQRAEPGRALRVALSLGDSLSLSESATGQVLVAYASQEVVRELEASRASVPGLERRERIRTQGYALSEQPSEDGILGVAVPLDVRGDGILCALSISGPENRVNVENALAALTATAAQMNRVLSIGKSLGARHDHRRNPSRKNTSICFNLRFRTWRKHVA